MCKALRIVVKLLVIIGALNWGLMGFFGYNVVTDIFGVNAMGDMSTGARVVYCLIGIAGLLMLVRFCKKCCGGGCGCGCGGNCGCGKGGSCGTKY